jgi:hypothetical protein
MKYIYLICPIVSLIVCQIIKFLIEIIKHKKFNLKLLFYGSGGMPSSHACFTSSLTMLIAFNEGFDSPLFAVACIFMLVTSYDAMGVRRECGHHARILNEKINYNLKENIGHEPLEVFVGLFVGTLVAFIFSLV